MALDSIFLIIGAIWLLVLTGLIALNLFFFAKLEKNTGQINLKRVLDRIISGEGKNHQDIDELFRAIRRLEDDGRLHVQKVGLIRFNPFREMGGDHSFSLALVDGRDTGVIITGLHTRERTRVYMKAIKAGRCEFELSDEEKKALAKAQKG